MSKHINCCCTQCDNESIKAFNERISQFRNSYDSEGFRVDDIIYISKEDLDKFMAKDFVYPCPR